MNRPVPEPNRTAVCVDADAADAGLDQRRRHDAGVPQTKGPATNRRPLVSDQVPQGTCTGLQMTRTFSARGPLGP